MEELEDPFVGQDVQDIPRLRIDDRQPVDLVLEQGVDGIKEAARETQQREFSLLWQAGRVKWNVKRDKSAIEDLIGARRVAPTSPLERY